MRHAVRRQRLGVLGQATAAVAAAGPKKRTDRGFDPLPVVECASEVARQMHTLHHVRNVDATKCIAKVADLVRERNHGRQHRVRRVLDHLGRLVVGLERRRIAERRIHLALHGDGARIGAADHDAVGAHEVVHRHALSEEFGVHADAEVDADALARSTRQLHSYHVVGGARHHRALDNHRVERRLVAQRLADLACRFADVGQIDARAIERCAHGDERDARSRVQRLRRSVVARRRVPTCRASRTSRPFSWIGGSPRLMRSTFDASMSTQRQSCPISAKQAPETRPT